ncbi:putative bolA-like protein [Verticillium dahliae VDG1]|nr:putative bolA-like protein [Verticillium dahliae VDG1]
MFCRPMAAAARRLAPERRAVCVSAARQHVLQASSAAAAASSSSAASSSPSSPSSSPSSSSASSTSRPKARPPRPAASAPDPPFATIPTCPAPTCSCAPTPPGLDIDHTSPLNGVISGYAEQVLVCTGRDDWASRIEEEDSGDNLAADLKELFGRGGTYSDPFHNVSVLNASFPSSTPRRRAELQTTSAYLLPSFNHIGGHKFAGNVIVYVPPGMRAQDGTEHGLAGRGIWYGRVEPRHVEGIVKETILGGRVIADMFRGGIDQQRKMLRM